MAVENLRKPSSTLVFNPWSDSLQDSLGFVISDY
jgi:hypothetical protein